MVKAFDFFARFPLGPIFDKGAHRRESGPITRVLYRPLLLVLLFFYAGIPSDFQHINSVARRAQKWPKWALLFMVFAFFLLTPSLTGVTATAINLSDSKTPRAVDDPLSAWQIVAGIFRPLTLTCWASAPILAMSPSAVCKIGRCSASSAASPWPFSAALGCSLHHRQPATR
jgi:hypothetical protein